jgi:hypothetical protein
MTSMPRLGQTGQRQGDAESQDTVDPGLAISARTRSHARDSHAYCSLSNLTVSLLYYFTFPRILDRGQVVVIVYYSTGMQNETCSDGAQVP